MDLYQEHILDHYHNPRNAGTLYHPTHARCATNPTCGDQICTTLRIENDTIVDIKFDGSGCAISQAATSMATEKIKGAHIANALAITRDDIVHMLGVEIGIGRIRCALLGIETIQKAIQYGKHEENN